MSAKDKPVESKSVTLELCFDIFARAVTEDMTSDEVIERALRAHFKAPGKVKLVDLRKKLDFDE